MIESAYSLESWRLFAWWKKNAKNCSFLYIS